MHDTTKSLKEDAIEPEISQEKSYHSLIVDEQDKHQRNKSAMVVVKTDLHVSPDKLSRSYEMGWTPVK